MASDTIKDDNGAERKDTNDNSNPPESSTTPLAQDAAAPIAAQSGTTGDSPAPSGQEPSYTPEENSPGQTQKPVTDPSDAPAHEPHTTADTTTAPTPSETQPANAIVTEVGGPSESRIGESTDRRGSLSIQQQTELSEDAGPSILLILLLTSGSRHPFKLDRKYLKKREVNAPDYNPYSMSVYTLKELILREWRSGMDVTLEVRGGYMLPKYWNG